WAAALFIAVVISAAGATRLWRPRPHPETLKRPHKIAILPFKPLGDDRVSAELGLGVAEGLIGKLSRLSAADQILVLPTNAVLQFRGKDTDSAAAGRLLEVDAVLDGTIQRQDDRIRVSAERTMLNDNRVIWSRQYDTKWNDLFTLQDSISIQLAE